MSDSETSMRVVQRDEGLPEAAAELFGHEAQQLFAQSGDGDREPVALGVVQDGAWVAGTLMVLEQAPGDGAAAGERVGSIRQLVVTPAVRGRGMAGRLLRRAMQVARDADCARIRSTAGFGCPDHLMLYHRLKFERTPGSERPYLVTRGLER